MESKKVINEFRLYLNVTLTCDPIQIQAENYFLMLINLPERRRPAEIRFDPELSAF
jgi:hypothetical protein